MNNKLYYQLAILLCALVLPAIAPASTTDVEYKTVYDQHLLKTHQLSELVQEVFAFPNDDDLETFFIVDDFFDQNRINKRLAMSVYFSFMLDFGVDLEFLSPYGITKISNTQYSIDNIKTPQWSIASDVFYYMSSPNNFEHAKRSLRTMGLSSDDLNIIEQYIRDNNIDIENTKLVFQYLKPLEKRIKVTKSASAKAALAFNFVHKFRIQKEYNWYKWVQKLLSQFPAMKQQALINYGTKNLGTSHHMPTPTSESKSISFANRITSGEYRNQLHKRIKAIESIVNNKGDK